MAGEQIGFRLWRGASEREREVERCVLRLGRRLVNLLASVNNGRKTEETREGAVLVEPQLADISHTRDVL